MCDKNEKTCGRRIRDDTFLRPKWPVQKVDREKIQILLYDLNIEPESRCDD